MKVGDGQVSGEAVTVQSVVPAMKITNHTAGAELVTGAARSPQGLSPLLRNDGNHASASRVSPPSGDRIQHSPPSALRHNDGNRFDSHAPKAMDPYREGGKVGCIHLLDLESPSLMRAGMSRVTWQPSKAH
jgi:hypothetical protein